LVRRLVHGVLWEKQLRQRESAKKNGGIKNRADPATDGIPQINKTGISWRKSALESTSLPGSPIMKSFCWASNTALYVSIILKENTMSPRRNRLSFHAINVEVEFLEDRVVPSGASGHVPAHAAEVISSAHDSASLPAAASSLPVTHTHLTGTLTSNNSEVKATGSVAFESQTHKQKTSSEFHVQVSGLAAATTFDVKVDGVLIGKITTNAAGSGQLELEFRSKAHPLPTNFPVISDKSIVTVGANLVAKLSTPAPAPHSETELQASLSDPTGVSTLKGDAEFESETVHGVTVSILTINVKKAAPGEKLDVKIDGVSVGSILVDDHGKGSLVLSSQPVDGQSLPFPANFPTLHDRSTIKLGAVAAGTFAKSR
jgi:hypothetical protein